MVMHQVPHPEQEKQANAFAAELLMPARHIRTELASGALSVPMLLDLKARWKVSMWALLRRAHTLGVISDWQYRTLAVEMSSVGYRTSEPGKFDAESPAAVTSIITQQLEQGRGISELASTAYLTQDEFVDLYLSCPVPSAADAVRRPISSTVSEAAR
jgi:Zn-dependent peptidase ImmA (M78 family)